MDRRRSRVLAAHLLKRTPFVLTAIAFSSIREVELERAEKCFLINFLMSLLSSALSIYVQLRHVGTVGDLSGFSLEQLALLAMGTVTLLSSLLAIFSYFSIGMKVVVERAVEIKPKD